jgi:NAD+ synthase (glutamine-hydrolysing)
VGDVTFGVTICEDMWYPEGPLTVQSFAGAEVILNINASPYHMGKGLFRERLLSTRAYDNSVVIAYLNTVGGQDELVFDGHSLVVNQRGEIAARGRQFEEHILVADLDLEAVFMKRLHDPRRRQQTLLANQAAVERIVIGEPEQPSVAVSGTPRKRPPVPPQTASSTGPSVEEEVYRALVLATRDYVLKNGFRKVCIGLSGGVDSSLVASVAADAIGSDNVTGVFMPSPYTSGESREDAAALARNLGVGLVEVPISEIFEKYLQVLRQAFGDRPADTTEENLQARIRGNILMGLSNKFGWLVLTTGNKSEMSVGYATLYGDMAGGFAVIKDVPKTLIYRISRWRNAEAGAALIPERVLLKEPTAELKPDQKVSDTLPPYDVLDPILEAYVERDESLSEILGKGFDQEMVRKTVRMVDTSEYKRRQAPPGIKITERAFGRDRRFPITNRYREW